MLTAEQATLFPRAVCERDSAALARLAGTLNPEQIAAVGRSLHALDPSYTMEQVRGLATWAKWALAGAALIGVGLAVSAEETGLLETGGGRYQNRRRAIGRGVAAPGFGGGGTCLLNDSLVLVEGLEARKVQDLEIGDSVKSLDVASGEVADTRVAKIIKNHVRDHFYVINGSLRITNDHPVLVVGANSAEWRRVEELSVGDRIKSVNGATEVKGITRIGQTATTVYLETVAGNFIVRGDDQSYVVKADYMLSRSVQAQ